MGFVFYDTETTGTDAAFDQFCNSRRSVPISSSTSWTVPKSVAASCPTSFRRRARCASLRYRRHGSRPLPHSHYEMSCRIRAQLLAWSPALFIGHNSLQFDEHLFRQALQETASPLSHQHRRELPYRCVAHRPSRIALCARGSALSGRRRWTTRLQARPHGPWERFRPRPSA